MNLINKKIYNSNNKKTPQIFDATTTTKYVTRSGNKLRNSKQNK